MAARKPPAQEYIPGDAETQNQLEYGRKMALYEAQNPPVEPEPEAPDPDDIALQKVLAELGNSGVDVKVNIYQVDARKKLAFAGAYLPSEFSIERVQSDYGPGDYQVRVYVPGGLKTRQDITIAAPKNVQAAQPAPALETQKIVETMQSGFQQLGQMFAQSIAALVQNQPKPKTTLETLQEFQLMKEVFGPAQSAPAQDPMAMITAALELSEKIRPREGEPSAGEIILKAVENFAPTINNMMAQAQANRPPAMMPHAPMIPAIPGPSTPPQSAPEEDMNLTMKIYARTLITAAQNGADPETYANNILDLLPEETILEFVNRPDWFGEVVKALPEAAPVAAWFAELKTAILELTKPETVASVDPTSKTVPIP